MLKIDPDRCTGCGACVDVCPHGAISIRGNIAVIDQKLCRQCENCVAICPANAISVVEPVYAQSWKGGNIMRGRGWFGWGYRGWGRGNPYPFCRFYPWLPRRWWAYRPGFYPMVPRGLYPQAAYNYYPSYTPYPW